MTRLLKSRHITLTSLNVHVSLVLSHTHILCSVRRCRPAVTLQNCIQHCWVVSVIVPLSKNLQTMKNYVGMKQSAGSRGQINTGSH